MGEPAVSRRVAHFGEPTDVLERVLLQAPSRRCASDASSPGGLPWRSCVHQRRPAIALATSGRTRRPRPCSPSRVNGLWLRYDPRHLRRLFALRADRRPGPRVPSTPAPFQDESRAGDEESFCRVIDPRGNSACPGSSRTSPRSLRRAAARAVRRLHLWSRASRWFPFGTPATRDGHLCPLRGNDSPSHR
jgi:hypothetical protein